MNHAWIKRLSAHEVAQRCRPFLEAEYPAARTMSDDKLAELIDIIHTDLTTLADSIQALHCYFHAPEINPQDPIFIELASLKPVIEAISLNLSSKFTVDENMKVLQEQISIHHADRKQTYKLIRIALSGASEGISISNLFKLLPVEEIVVRLKRICHS
jgi:glutamyl/glutaminyl-tRNA synthetase